MDTTDHSTLDSVIEAFYSGNYTVSEASAITPTEHPPNLAPNLKSPKLSSIQVNICSLVNGGRRNGAVDDCDDMQYWILPLISLIAVVVALVIMAQAVYCLLRLRRRKRTSTNSSESNSPAQVLARLRRTTNRSTITNPNSGHGVLSTITSVVPPPRYSQILFDQADGASIFEETPPDYEVTQPDLVQTLSRGSSLNRNAKHRITRLDAVTVVDETDGGQKVF